MSIFVGVVGLVGLLGVFSWSFFEYALHNWVGHKGKGRNELSREHLKHHSKAHYFTPTFRKVLGALAVLVPLGVVLSWLVGWSWGMAYTVGLGLGYWGYELVHRRLHTHAPWNRYGRWARKHHFFHHFGNPKVNHGVTTGLWDRVFGTYQEPGQIRVPEALAMPWLLDPKTGEVHEAWAADYVLVRKKSRRSMS